MSKNRKTKTPKFTKEHMDYLDSIAQKAMDMYNRAIAKKKAKKGE